MNKILLIDDDPGLGDALKTYFSRFDLTLSVAHHPRDGLRRLSEEGADLVILDVMLPEMDGFEVCRRIRVESEVPIVMLTARGEVTDRVVGLELGADDYLPKPFDPRELVARVQRILKRAGGRETSKEGELVFVDLQVDKERQSVRVQGEEIGLSHMEYRLVELLASRPGHPFSRDEILNALRGIEADLYTRAVDVLVSRVRQKLRPTDYIKTVRGAGYSFVAPRA
ncbi:MAG: response regulator transcription factor [Chromatiales bacterium]|nr:response regulator transcription factor [Chromatiales bacterium]